MLEQAEEAGISIKTLERARKALKVKARQGGGGKGWFMSIPDIMEKIKDRDVRRANVGHKVRRFPPAFGRWQISDDCAAVAVDGNKGGERPKIDIPARKSLTGGIRVKVGAYEFEADENFPADKLAKLLRGLGGDMPC
ncbi:hypothetical protein AGMMS49975_22790 [Clostridia bacterium]|nr:hypothetical protein AGMMS49975_22790 [Clostridia bacterium]